MFYLFTCRHSLECNYSKRAELNFNIHIKFILFYLYLTALPGYKFLDFIKYYSIQYERSWTKKFPIFQSFSLLITFAYININSSNNLCMYIVR